MGRMIDLTQPLSDADKEFLNSRGRHAEVAYNEQVMAEGGFGDDGDGGGQSDDPDNIYDAMTVADLKAMIEERNASRDEGDHLSKSGNKGELIATLEADDAE